jgi:hypothetical protein
MDHAWFIGVDVVISDIRSIAQAVIVPLATLVYCVPSWLQRQVTRRGRVPHRLVS